MLTILYCICTILTIVIFFVTSRDWEREECYVEAGAVFGVVLLLGPFAYALPLVALILGPPIYMLGCICVVIYRFLTGYYKKEQ